MADPHTHRTELAMLSRWRPLRFGGGLVVLALLWPAGRYALDFGHFAPHGLNIETDGASGAIRGGRYAMDLPLAVFNDSGRAITGITLWVDGYACAAADDPAASCRHIASFAQAQPMYLADGESGHFNASAQGPVPAAGAGGVLKIVRRIEEVRDDADAPGALRTDVGTIDGPIEHSEHH